MFSEVFFKKKSRIPSVQELKCQNIKNQIPRGRGLPLEALLPCPESILEQSVCYLKRWTRVHVRVCNAHVHMRYVFVAKPEGRARWIVLEAWSPRIQKRLLPRAPNKGIRNRWRRAQGQDTQTQGTQVEAASPCFMVGFAGRCPWASVYTIYKYELSGDLTEMIQVKYFAQFPRSKCLLNAGWCYRGAERETCNANAS